MKIDKVQILCYNTPINERFIHEISGKVVLISLKEIILKDEINITLEGKASVKFSASEVNWFKHDKKRDYKTIQPHDLLKNVKHLRRLSDSQSYSEKQILINYIHPLVEVGKTLKCGENIFPFTFQLSPDLPASFESKYGNIKYKLKVRKKIRDTIYKIEVKVGSPDMSALLYQNPQWEREFICTGRMKDDITISMYLTKICFRVGEPSQLAIEVVNNSDITVHHLTLYFKQIIYWIGKHRGHRNVKTKEEILSTCKFNSVRAKDTIQFIFDITIPQVRYTNIRINTCPIIKVFNVLSLVAKCRKLLSSTKCCIDIPLEIFSKLNTVEPFVIPAQPVVGFIYQPPMASSSTSSSNSTHLPSALQLTLNLSPNHSSDPQSEISNPPSTSGNPSLPLTSDNTTSIPPTSLPPPYSSVSDPPPPYPGTPPDLAESIQKLRFS